MSSVKPKIEYKQFKYPPDHWSVSNKTFTECGICVMEAFGHNYAVFLNPNSRYAYRLLVQLIAPSNDLLITTFNRRWTNSEINGLYLVIGRAATLLMDDGLIGQGHVLGNGSHSFDKKTRATTCGKEDEPSMLHGHIFFRGDPDYEYFPGIKLIGPDPGYAVPIASGVDNKSAPEVVKQQIGWTDNKQRATALNEFKKRVMKLKNECKFKLIDNTKAFDAASYVDKKSPSEDEEESKQHGQ